MKNICRGHSDDLLDEVIHKEITANSDKPKICKAQQGLTGSSKGDIIGAENSATLPSCAQGFLSRFHNMWIRSKTLAWLLLCIYNHCPDLLTVFGFQSWLLKKLFSLCMGEFLSLGPPSQLVPSATALLGLWFLLLLSFQIFTWRAVVMLLGFQLEKTVFSGQGLEVDF